MVAWRSACHGTMLVALVLSAPFVVDVARSADAPPPLRHDGDAVQYEVAVAGRPERHLVRFETQGWTYVQDPEGREQRLLAIRESAWPNDARVGHTYFVRPDGSLVAWSNAHPAKQVNGSSVSLLAGTLTVWPANGGIGPPTEVMNVTETLTEFGTGRTLCGLAGPIGDAAQTTCRGMAPFLGLSGAHHGDVRLSWRAGVPYAATIQTGQVRAQLVGLEPRGVALAPAAPRPAVAHAAVPLSPANAGAPDETGFHQEFSLASAREVGERLACFQYWLDSAPGAYLASARSTTVIHERSWLESRWDLEYAARTGPVLRIRVQTEENPLPQKPGPLFKPNEDSMMVQCNPADSEVARPPKKALPDRLPSVAEMARRWDEREDGAATNWGFEVLCGVSCDEPLVQVFVGVSDVHEDTGPTHPVLDPIGTQWRGVAKFIGADQDGLLRFRLEATTDGAAPLLPIQAADPEAAARAVGTAPLDDLPPPRWFLASAAALGLLVGLKALVSWILHTRLAKSRLLDHPARARLVELIEAEPGIHYRMLLKAAELVPGTLSHHLTVLERGGLVRRSKHGGFTCYFPPATSSDMLAARVVARAASSQWILRSVRDQPGVTAKTLAERRGVHPSTILHYVHKLVQAGLIERTRVREGLALQVTPKGLSCIAPEPPAEARGSATPSVGAP